MAEGIDPILQMLQTLTERCVQPTGRPEVDHDRVNLVEVSQDTLTLETQTPTTSESRRSGISFSEVTDCPENTTQKSQNAAQSIGGEDKEISVVEHENSTSQTDFANIPYYIMVIHNAEGGISSYQCKICKRKFSTVSRMTLHEYCAGKEKPYKCERCGKRTLRKRDHERHLKTHSAEGGFNCPYCEQSFDLKRKLNSHLKSHVILMNAEQYPIYESHCPLKCHICEVAAFKEKVDLRNHFINGHNINEELAETLTTAVVANAKSRD